jgi:alginate O-acetyltransferase complex protein AlgI
MVFSSIIFIFYFLPLFFLCFLAFGFNKNVLLVFSIIFYSWGEPIFVPLVVVMVLINHRLGLLIEKGHEDGRAGMWVIIGIIANLLPLLIFKYGGFLVRFVVELFGQLAVSKLGISPDQVTVNNLPLPLGISFYTFHSLSYLIDVYRKDVRAERSLRDLAVYISMFPQLVAGPIIRYKTIAGELHEPVITSERAAKGIRIFVIGLSQKVLIANTVAASADQIFGLPPDQLSTSLAWLGIVCYTLQIYYDFGGYSNMAIGLAFMLGFTFPINFDYPYMANSMTDFWRRWHITLSTWFRDYLYVPLGGNRLTAVRTYLNLWTVFLLCGLWHGAALNFLVWGALHGALLVLERVGLGSALERSPSLLRHAYVLFMVMITWVFFRADSLSSSVHYLAAMFGLGPEADYAPPLRRFLGWDVIVAMFFGVLIAAPYGARLGRAIADRAKVGSLQIGHLSGMVVLFALVALSLAGGAYNPFIYFRF